MNLKQLTGRAKEVHEKYSELNKKNIGREWTKSEIAQGFVGDVGDLMKLVMANEGVREIDDALARIEAKTYGVCLATRKRISKARLRAKPWAKYCIEHARKRELGLV